MVTNGRTAGGRFAKGNPGGPGNPHAGKVGQLRAAILAAVTPEDVEAIVRAMIQRAKGGDMAATKELLDRAIGKPTDGDLAERLLDQKLGPIMREARAADRADDYEAVMQMAVAIGRDGKLHTNHRADAPKHAMVPLMAACRHLLRKLEKDLCGRLQLREIDLDPLVEPIIRSIIHEEFEARWDKFSKQDSRTDRKPNTLESGGSGLHIPG